MTDLKQNLSTINSSVLDKFKPIEDQLKILNNNPELLS